MDRFQLLKISQEFIIVKIQSKTDREINYLHTVTTALRETDERKWGQ